MAHPKMIPASVGALAPLAGDGGRYATQGVRVSLREDGYRAEATDGRMLGILTGPYPSEAGDYAGLPDLSSAPNGESAATVPARPLAAACRAANAAAKLKRDAKRRGARSAAPAVAVVIGRDVTTLGAGPATQGEAPAHSDCVKNVEGRFPDTDFVIPRDAAKASVVVNADQLAELLKAAAEACYDGDISRVTLELRGPQTPVVLRASGPRGERFLGVLMPLS